MKLKLQSKKAFTIIEIVTSILVMAGFITAVMYLYSRSNSSFKITAWKQERTAQADIFWTYMRKALEEATNRLEFEFKPGPGGVPEMMLNEMPRPFKFHPDPTGAPDGNIMTWNVSKTNIDMMTSNHTSVHNIFALVKSGHRLTLVGGARPIFIDDVVRIEFKISSVIKTPNNTEETKDGANPAAIGTFLEISLIMAPPDGYIAGDLRVPMNHKFRLNVAPFSDSAPTY
ncbi:MAG: hypothetical protein KKB51_14340 [Candidatus Riflebacteria bacterium]|nr:hypothetical protein [Candidatus Riflebacteria bacterium]